MAAGVVIALLGAAYLTFTPKSEPEDSESKAESNSEVKESSSEKLEISKVENSAVQADSYYPIIEEKSVPVASNSYSPYTQDEQQNISVYEKCNEAVVNITTQVMGINWFLEPVVQEGGSGSGSIIDKRGYVVTNVHVISNASKINISL